jgi:PAS domain S-box-containing protein
MSWQNNPFSVLLIAGSFILLIIANLAWRRRPVTGAKAFTLLILAMAEWTITYGIELGSVSREAKILWDQAQFVGIVVVPFAWLILTLQYTGAERIVTSRNLILLTIEPVIIMILVLTNRIHGQIWSQIKLQNIDSFLMLDQTPGTGFWFHTAYSYLLLLIGSILLIRVLFGPSSIYRKQAGSLLIGAILPWLANATSLFGLNIFPYLDLTTFSFILTGPVMAMILFGFQFLNIVPVAYSAVLESMSDSVIIVDTHNNIVDLNPSAQNVFGRSASKVIGQPVTSVFANWNELLDQNYDIPLADGEIILDEVEKQRNYDLRISPLKDHKGRLTGRLIVLRDITELKNAERLQDELAALQRVMNKIIQAMALIVEMKDPYTAGHERRVAKLSAAIAESMGLTPEQIDVIQIAAMIHDIGKINVPAEILSKPGQLNGLEYSLVQTHPQAAYDILKTVDLPWPIAEIVLQHHEKIDGSGYPAGLSGDAILLEAKIIAVADLVEAMTSHRPYRPSTGIDKALKEIMKYKGILYDPQVVDACLKVLEQGFKLDSKD